MGTDGTWRTSRARAWLANAHFINDLNFQEVYTFGIDPEQWAQVPFDDADWVLASVLGSAEGKTPGGEDLPWPGLVPRDISLLEHKVHLPRDTRGGEVIEWMATNYSNDPAVKMSLEPVLSQENALVQGEMALLDESKEAFCLLRNSDLHEAPEDFDGIYCATIIIDFGHLMNANLHIDVEGGGGVYRSSGGNEQGAFLDIGYGPDLVQGRVMPHRCSRTRWADRLNLIDKRRSWRSFGFRQFRYVQITLRDALRPAKLFSVKTESVTHSFETTATFACSDKELKTFWKASERVGEFTTLDLSTGGEFREGGPIGRSYVGMDEAHVLHCIEAVHGNTPFCRRWMEHISYG